jgi:hypothetical protein
MITMQRPDAIKPAGGFDVIACFWAFSNATFDQQLAILNRWKSFLAPGGRMVFDMRHPDHDLAGYHVENMIGKSLFYWKMAGPTKRDRIYESVRQNPSELARTNLDDK